MVLLKKDRRYVVETDTLENNAFSAIKVKYIFYLLLD